MGVYKFQCERGPVNETRDGRVALVRARVGTSLVFLSCGASVGDSVVPKVTSNWSSDSRYLFFSYRKY